MSHTSKEQGKMIVLITIFFGIFDPLPSQKINKSNFLIGVAIIKKNRRGLWNRKLEVHLVFFSKFFGRPF